MLPLPEKKTICSSNLSPSSNCYLIYDRLLISKTGSKTGSKTNLELRRQFFTNRVVGPWNSLPQEIKMAPSLGTFKSKLKNHFL